MASPTSRLLCVLACLLLCTRATGENLDVSLSPLGSSIPGDFVGLSYESAGLRPDPDGKRSFHQDNKALVTLFRLLGVKSLRVGGNSVDRTPADAFTQSDIDLLFGFARKAELKVIFSVRLHQGDPAAAATMAEWILPKHAELLDSFAIGNEPDSYKDYPLYRRQWMDIRMAMTAVAPSARFSGPDQNPKAAFYAQVAKDLLAGGHLNYLSGHSYPADCAYRNPSSAKTIEELIPVDVTDARERLLSDEMHARYREILNSFLGSQGPKALPFRLTETNSLWYGGLKGASDSHAAALWALDYLYWWAAQGILGINFHTGDRVGGGESVLPSRYAAFVSSEKGYSVRPLGYAMTLFSLGSHGTLVSSSLRETDTKLRAYAVLSSDNLLTVTLINRNHGPSASASEVTLHLPEGMKAIRKQSIHLTAPDNDPAATRGLLLGGAEIAEDGSWKGQWQELPGKPTGPVILSVAPASAAVLRMKLEAPKAGAPAEH